MGIVPGRSRTPPIRVSLRYFAECPQWRVAHARLLRALRLAGLEDVEPVLEEVGSVERADRAGIVASPTFLVDGVDPFPTSSRVDPCCRAFETPEGPAPCPTIEQLRDVLAGSVGGTT